MQDRGRYLGMISVSRFGEILLLWQKVTRLWQIFDGLFLMLNLLKQMCDIMGQFSLLQMAKY